MFTTKTAVINGQEVQVKVYPVGAKSRKRRVKPELDSTEELQGISDVDPLQLPENLRHLVAN